MVSDYLFLAFRNVRKRGIRSWLTMLGVFIGIAAVVSLISLGDGLETAITGEFDALSIDSLTIQGADTGFAPPGTTSVSKMTQEELEIIDSISGVGITIPRYLRFTQIEFNDVLGFGAVGSIPEEDKLAQEVYEAASFQAAEGRLLEEGDSGKIVVGDNFVSTDLYGKKVRVGSTLKVNDENFEVIGVLERSSTFFLNDAVLMLEEDVKELFEIPEDEIDFIVARVHDPDDLERVADEIERRIRRERDQKPGEEDFEVQTPSQSLGAVNTIIGVIQIVVGGIALIALLVGGIGIANTMFTSVLERTREIGVMKSIGARNRDILYVFIIESAILGLVGGIVGALLFSNWLDRISQKKLFITLIFLSSALALVFYAVLGLVSAIIVYFLNGMLAILITIASMKLIVGVCPSRFEATTFALMTSITNLGSGVFAGALGGYLYAMIGYENLILLNAGWSLLPLVLVPKIFR